MEEKQMQNKLLTINEVRQRLAVSRTTIYAMLNSGDLRAIKLGGATRVPVAEVERVIAEAKDWKGAA